MILKTRYNWSWSMPKKVSTPIKLEFEYITQIEPISFNEDKSIKEYKEKDAFIEKKSLWKDYIKSFDLGSISDQVISHITRGTPLVTAHTLPAGDYTKDNVLKGAEVVREMQSKGITLEMIESALALEKQKSLTKEVPENGQN